MAKQRTHKDIILLTTISLILGLMIMLSIHTHNAAEVQTENNHLDLTAYIEEMETENALLEVLIQETRQKIESLESSQEEDQTYIAQLNAMLNRLNMLAQITALEGPGIIITMNDNVAGAEYAKKNNPATYRAEQYIIHDKDILYTIRSLANETEACAVNDIRITDASSIRCVGTTILIDSTRLAAPYEIKLLGSADRLEKALLNCATYNNLLYYNMPIKYEKQELITLAPYTKGYTTNYTMLQEETKDSTTTDQ